MSARTVAVVGAGRMGRRHIQAIRDAGLNLVGVCDLNVESLAIAQEEQAVPARLCYRDFHALLREVRPECVIVATTAPTHCDFTCRAAQSGAQFILCEKPMAISLVQCDKMIDICASRGVRLAVNHQMRFMAQYVEPKEMLQSEQFGGLTSVTAIAGNFGMAMNGTHYFEMFRFMTDEVPQQVSAWFSAESVPNVRGPQFEDRGGTVRIVTPSGKRMYMDASSDQGHGLQVIYGARYGQIVVDELAGSIEFSVRKAEHRGQPTTRYGMPAQIESRRIAPVDAVVPSRAVLEALISGENWPTGEDGRLAVNTLVAAYVSNEQVRSIRPDDPDLPRDRTFPWA